MLYLNAELMPLIDDWPLYSYVRAVVVVGVPLPVPFS